MAIRIGLTRALTRALGLAGLLATLPALAIVQLDDLQPPVGSLDSRVGALSPLPEAMALVAAHADWSASWNRYGTVGVLQRRGGFLASGLDADPAHAELTARTWIKANRALFRLSDASVDALELVRNQPLNQSQAQVLLFRQSSGGMPVAYDGRIKIGLVAGKLFWVASSSIGDIGALPAANITAAQAWNAAANAVLPALGIGVPALAPLPSSGSWNLFDAGPAFTGPQRVRTGIVGLPGLGAVPAYEANVVRNDVVSGQTIAYTAYVDATNGKVLLRQDRVQQIVDVAARGASTRNLPQPADTTAPFTGDYPANQVGMCGPCHGPYTAQASDGFTKLVASVAGAVPANDLFIDLYHNDATCSQSAAKVAHEDTGVGQEVLAYQPASGLLPVGDYYVSICPYSAAVGATNYAGTVTMSTASTPTLASNPMWHHFRVAPSLDYSDNDTREAGCWLSTNPDNSPIAECTEQYLDGSSHRIPWDYVGNAPSFTTRGNNATTVEGWNAAIGGGNAYQPAPTPGRDYKFPWANTWHANACNPSVIDHAVGTGNDIDAAIVNLHTFHNRLHDFAYHLGLQERQGVAQLSNYGQTDPSFENDAELGIAQAGALDGGFPSYLGRDNANQVTLQDGVTPISNMYLWQTIGGAAYAPCVDGDFDAQVFTHEYGHLVQNRMTDPANGLSGQSGRSMGEGWSDLNMLMFLDEWGYSPENAPDKYALGSYIAGDTEKGIRNYPLNHNPLNLSDQGYDVSCESGLTNVAGTCEVQGEVHSDGEVWVGMQVDMRAALIAKYDALGFDHANALLRQRCAEGQITADHCSGERRWAQLIHDGMLLQPSAPTYLDARDAFVAADVARAADATQMWPSNQAELWDVLAERGWGQDAAMTSPDDIDPVASWASPLAANTSVHFDVRDLLGNPVTAVIFVGPYEARATPAADTDAATPLADTLPMRPGTYDFIVRADGFGHTRVRATVSGAAQTVDVRLAPNYASAAAGATITGMGTAATLPYAIDEREATDWEWSVDVSQPTVTDTVDGTKPSFTIALAGGAHEITRVQVSGNIQVTVGDVIRGRMSSLHQFALAVCDSAVSDCTQDASYTTVYTSPDGAFPSAPFRPIAPDMTLREFRLAAPVHASHLRFIALHNKCSGTPAYWGYFGQPGVTDNDPANNTDCRVSNGKLYRKDGAVRVAEVEVFGYDAINDRIFADGFGTP